MAGRPPIGYDVASIDIGITSEMPDLPGFAEHGVPAKPLGPFASAVGAVRAGRRGAASRSSARGVGGAELAMAMACAAAGPGRTTVRLVDRGRALEELPDRARSTLLERLAALGVELVEGATAAEVRADALVLETGASCRRS